MTALLKEKCTPCAKGEGKLPSKEVQELLPTVKDWQLGKFESTLERSFNFKNFKQALAFVQKIAELAETEQHHPDITFGWGYVMVALTSHSAGGLTRNDFIVAAKIDALPQSA